MSEKIRIGKLILLFLVALLGCQAALGQMEPVGDNGEKVRAIQQDWREMMHYALMGNWEMAQGHGEKLLGADPDPVVLLNLAEDERYADNYRNLALLQADSPLKEVASRILRLVEEGRFQQRTNTARIAAEINRLSGTTRGRMMAVGRLKDSGEWAVPVIIQVLRDPSRSDELSVIQWALWQIGKPAVNPLVVVLQECDELNIRLIVLEALGKIGYRSALPYVQQVIESEPANSKLHGAAVEAFETISNQAGQGGVSSSVMFEQLGQRYYSLDGSVTAPANYDYANIWFWEDQKGLYYERVKRGAFDELMTMRCCEQAVRLDVHRPGAIGLWLSAFFRLESEGYAQPEYFGVNHADADTYAVTAGPEYLHRVLDRALEDRNQPVALGAIRALQHNSGQQSLLFELQSRQPLITALGYPDQEVRLSAALVLGQVRPQEAFEHSEEVVPLLAEALQQKGLRFAVVVDKDEMRRNRLTAALREEGGFTEVISDDRFTEAIERARRKPSVDLMVISSEITSPRIEEALGIIANDYKLAFCPTIVATPVEAVSRTSKLEKDSSFVKVVAYGSTVEELMGRMAKIMAENDISSLTQDEADRYARQAVGVLRQLALVRNSVLDLRPAQETLIAALADERREILQAATETLAMMDSLEAQRAIAGLALDEKTEAGLRLMAFANLATSAKAYGNLLLAEQVDRIYNDMVSSLAADAELRKLAARAYGSLNLPSAKISQLILDQSKSSER